MTRPRANESATVVPIGARAEPEGAENRVFREEALHAFREARGDEGELLLLPPRWLRLGFWLSLAVLIAGGFYVVFGTVATYAVGPAVVRVDGRLALTSLTGGTVARIAVQPGQRVVRHQVLVEFQGVQEMAELARLDKEIELHLIKLLRDPSDRGARDVLAGLRAQQDLAAAHVAEKSLRAPVDGLVSDVRIRPGQLLAAGELVLSLVEKGSRFSLVAFLAGHDRPYLKRGMSIRVELAGFPYAYQDTLIDSVGDEVIGPAEARRFLGPDLADTIGLEGPVVMVKGHLPAQTFVFDDKRYDYYDGSPARAEVRVRRRRIATLFVPALARLLGDPND